MKTTKLKQLRRWLLRASVTLFGDECARCEQRVVSECDPYCPQCNKALDALRKRDAEKRVKAMSFKSVEELERDRFRVNLAALKALGD